MKTVSIVKRALCILCAAALIVALSACGKEKKTAKTSVAPTTDVTNPFAAKETGKLTDKGYELPYEYTDGYKAVFPVPGKCEFLTTSTTPGGNMTFHLTTDKTEKEVKDFYNDYFSKLQKVKAKQKTDESVGYFDKDRRIILFNLNVWNASNKTNFKLGAEQCEKLEDSKIFEAAK